MYNIRKCPIPIIWLDTSVMLSLTRYMNNPQKLQDSLKHQISNLYDLLLPAVKSGKCITPVCDQGEEVIGPDREDEWFNAMKKITLGIISKSAWDIQILQLRAAMNGAEIGSDSIELSYQDIFEDDPVAEIKSVLSNKLLITVYFASIRTPNSLLTEH